MGNFYAKFVRSGILFAFREGVPRTAFDDEPPPPAPDYDDADAWGALPGRAGEADRPQHFPVVFNIVIVCQDSTAEVAAVLRLLLLQSDLARTHRSGPHQGLCNAIQKVQVVVRHHVPQDVSARGCEAFAGVRHRFGAQLEAEGVTRAATVAQAEADAQLQLLSRLDVITSSAMVLLLSAPSRRKFKVRHAAHAHKFVDIDPAIVQECSTTTTAADAAAGGGGSVDTLADAAAAGVETPEAMALDCKALCVRLRSIVCRRLFEPLIPQVPVIPPADAAATAASVNRRAVDVFFVHPTGFFGARWNGPFDNPKAREAVDTVLATQLSIFQEDCNMYLPRYRQATFTSYFNNCVDSRKAFELAYSDVRRAFLNFLARAAAEAEGGSAPRPFVLASHSQGGHHLIRLLEEEVEGHADPAVLARCVCVYIVGSKIPTDKLDPAVGLRRFRMSRGPRDTGCLVAWDAATSGRGVVTHPRFVGYWYRDGWRVARRDERFIATNPLTWRSWIPPAPESTDATAVTDAAQGGGNSPSDGSAIASTAPDPPASLVLGPAAVAGPEAHLGVVVPYAPSFGRARTIKYRTDYLGQVGDGMRTTGLIYNPLRLSAFVDTQSHDLVVSPPFLKSNFGIAEPPSVIGYHAMDYNLFYFNLRANVKDRIAAFFAARELATVGTAGGGAADVRASTSSTARPGGQNAEPTKT